MGANYNPTLTAFQYDNGNPGPSVTRTSTEECVARNLAATAGSTTIAAVSCSGIKLFACQF